ncbi:Down syndrome cell adhesion molecule-like protein 1 isoform X2 [Stegodyphus dumicola]|uniref:Down syndrome cell adhesion molecule-like protein 1 isoform X2 n=1 Tax=Stegodyphus dumicola TaxID=202533 RepID=UPI0015B2EE80|nr:Down syndrome cell adhesion molecule-like protein 1 isoform X2 [Stegodyphus dumicola]
MLNEYPFSKIFIIQMLMVIMWDTVVGDGSLQVQPFFFPPKSIIGKRVSVACTPAAGEKMEFKWLKNGKALLKGLNIDIRTYSDLTTLVIDPLTEEDTGNYTCIVNARGKTGSYTANLEVLVPPSWSHTPYDVDALSGDSVIMNCKGIGRPNPTVTWSRTQGENMEFIPISSFTQYAVHPNGSLFINSIQKEDEGMYKCNVSNGIGVPLLKTTVVKVIVTVV